MMVIKWKCLIDFLPKIYKRFYIILFFTQLYGFPLLLRNMSNIFVLKPKYVIFKMIIDVSKTIPEIITLSLP